MSGFLGAALALGPLLAGPAHAQNQTSQWFVPGQAKPQTAPRPSTRSVPSPAAVPEPPAGLGGPVDLPGVNPEAGGTAPQVQMQLPPAPEIPPIPKGSATPAAIIGILSVPDVLRVSTAYQAAYKELNARAQKLNEDAQKEQNALRELGQNFAAERSKLSPEQIRAKEREITDRATEAQRRFGERNRIIQEAGQYVMAQLNRTMEQVAQQVALSRGINLVLNRAQILGTTADFDLTPAVAEVLNKVLPSVVVPPDGVSPLTMAKPETANKTAAKEAPAAKPAAKTPQKH
ncbi:MAG TPA: OmpH family outer membrane protein [Rhodopila sp.]|uniref:OmpH family outer membrane protein n=1 Tax=Rhodopila sp. TaxID=2480087 RepID=UPI002C3AFD24|nr:OmpH family outer membrane protein [Rhodopila sp.]HVY18323.1 OmpH family outer membrane protein [Rhodopila sp.]